MPHRCAVWPVPSAISRGWRLPTPEEKNGRDVRAAVRAHARGATSRVHILYYTGHETVPAEGCCLLLAPAMELRVPAPPASDDALRGRFPRVLLRRTARRRRHAAP